MGAVAQADVLTVGISCPGVGPARAPADRSLAHSPDTSFGRVAAAKQAVYIADQLSLGWLMNRK